MIVLIIITGILMASLMEYMLHKYYLHKSGEHPHIAKHHVLFHGKTTYESQDASYKDIVSNIGYILFTWSPCGLVAIILFPINTSYAMAFALSGVLYTVWVEFVHYLFHKPHGWWIEENRLFQNLKEHHRIHHIYFKSNYGIGASFWDYIVKTEKHAIKKEQ